jgi:hypothetical protein
MVYKLKFVWIGSSVKLDYPITKTVACFSYYICKVIWKVTCTLLSMTSLCDWQRHQHFVTRLGMCFRQIEYMSWFQTIIFCLCLHWANLQQCFWFLRPNFGEKKKMSNCQTRVTKWRQKCCKVRHSSPTLMGHNIVGMQTMFDSEIGVDEGSHSLILPHVETAKHL